MSKRPNSEHELAPSPPGFKEHTLHVFASDRLEALALSALPYSTTPKAFS